MAFVNSGQALVHFAGPTDVIDGFVDQSIYGTGTEITLVLPPGAVVNHNSVAIAPNRACILRAGANFTSVGRARVIDLKYGSVDGTNFFWVQPE